MPVMTRSPKGDEIVILSRDEYDRLVAAGEDAADARTARRVIDDIASGAETVLNESELEEFLNAKTPLAFWRKKRQMTQAKIAREREVKERRARKLEKKRAAAAERKAEAEAVSSPGASPTA